MNLKYGLMSSEDTINFTPGTWKQIGQFTPPYSVPHLETDNDQTVGNWYLTDATWQKLRSQISVLGLAQTKGTVKWTFDLSQRQNQVAFKNLVSLKPSALPVITPSSGPRQVFMWDETTLASGVYLTGSDYSWLAFDSTNNCIRIYSYSPSKWYDGAAIAGATGLNVATTTAPVYMYVK